MLQPSNPQNEHGGLDIVFVEHVQQYGKLCGWSFYVKAEVNQAEARAGAAVQFAVPCGRGRGRRRCCDCGQCQLVGSVNDTLIRPIGFCRRFVSGSGLPQLSVFRSVPASAKALM